MDDLHFIIVNSKLPHAQLLLPELERRVSFEVFQETDEEEVWSMMEGGKDDMYIYDRCGRLAYYIPFPLSIMLEGQNVVSSAIFATYFRSPCGVTCGGNQSSELEDFLDHLNSTDEDTAVTTEETAGSPTDIQRTNKSEVSDITDFIDTLPAAEQVINNVNVYENNFPPAFNDSDYQIANDTLEYDMTNDTNIDKKDTNIDKVNELFNNLYNLLFHSRSNETKNNSSDISSTNMTVTDSLEVHSHLNPENHSGNHTEQNHHKHKPNVAKTNRNKISDRCAEANFVVCKDWSKTRLIHAQTCCTSARSELKDEAESCRNFGKKRCKKIRSILKCCINTAFTEATTADAVTTVESTSTDMPAADFKDVVCCKNIEEGKLCRVVETPVCDAVCPPVCDEDEYIDDSTNMTK